MIESRRSAIPAVLAVVLVLLAVSEARSQELINLGTLPGLNPYQAQVGTAIDIVCPQLARMGHSLNSAQQDLLKQCTVMKTGQLGTGLDNALSNVTTVPTT